MSSASSTSPIDRSGARNALGELRAVQEEFQGFFLGVLDDLDGLSGEMELRQKAWHSDRQSTASENDIPAEATLPSQADTELLQRLRQLEQERAEYDRERVMLETELESVRNRAADMAETLTEQKRQMDDDRARWTDEFGKLRGLLERSSLAHAQREEGSLAKPSPQPLPQRTAAAGPPPKSADDPALDSVLAQFEMLQRDIAKRKKTAAGSR